MPIMKLQKFLDENHVKYITVNHSPAYTAREVAASVFLPRRDFAKVIMVKIDGRMAMAVLPASRRIDMDKLCVATGATHVEMANEDEFKTLFPACETGAMPPFGNLYEMDVWIDNLLVEDDDIFFNAGTHTQLMQMAFEDYQELVKPNTADFAVKE